LPGAGSKAHTQARHRYSGPLPPPLAPRPVPHRPAPGRGREVHRQMPRRPPPLATAILPRHGQPFADVGLAGPGSSGRHRPLAPV